MAESDDVWGCLGAVLWVAVVVAAVVTAIAAMLSVGALFGAGTALRNYGMALANNVKPERATP